MKNFSIPVLLTASLASSCLLVSAAAPNNNGNNTNVNNSKSNSKNKFSKKPYYARPPPLRYAATNITFAPDNRQGPPKDLYHPAASNNTKVKQLFTSEVEPSEKPVTAPVNDNKVVPEIKKPVRNAPKPSAAKTENATQGVSTAQEAPNIRILTRTSPVAQAPSNETKSTSNVPFEVSQTVQPAFPVKQNVSKPSSSVGPIYDTPVQTNTMYFPALSVPTMPIFGQPMYQQPMYQQPIYQQPMYQQPMYQQPIYQQPMYQQPIYQQPMYQQQTPMFYPPQTQFFSFPNAPRPSITPMVVIPEFNIADVEKVLPKPLAQAIRSISFGHLVNKELTDFFNLAQRNAVSNFPTVLEFLRETMVRISKMHVNENDAQYPDLLVALDSFLRCYTASFLVCTYEQREYIIKKGLLASISDVTFAIRQQDPVVGLKGIIDALFLDGRITKDKFYHLGISFIKYLKVLKSTPLMTNAFHFKFNAYIDAAEKVMKLFKKELVASNQFVSYFADYLSAPRVPQLTRTMPSMQIVPLRVYVTKALESYVPKYARDGKSDARQEVALFWKLTERAFIDYDVILEASRDMLLPNVPPKVRQVHLEFVRYYLQTHILENIELAFNRLFYIPQTDRSMMIKKSKAILTCFFEFEEKRLLTIAENSSVTLEPAINTVYSFDDIISNDPSVPLGPLITQLEQARDLLSPTSVLSIALSEFANALLPIVKFVRFNRTYIIREYLKRLESIIKMPFSAVYAESYEEASLVQPYFPEVYAEPGFYAQPTAYIQPAFAQPEMYAQPEVYFQPEEYAAQYVQYDRVEEQFNEEYEDYSSFDNDIHYL